MQNVFYVKYNKELDNQEAQSLINKMTAYYKDNKSSELYFFYTIYEFKALRTNLGFSDLLLKGTKKPVIKKSDLLKEVFGISKGTYSKICKICERFIKFAPNSEGDYPIPEYIDYVIGFNSSKLFELLALPEEVLKLAILHGRIKYTMTVREIRKTVKEILKGEEPIEEEKDTIPTEDCEVPEHINVSQVKYSAEDLKQYKKDELIHMYLDLQMAYFKIKEKR